MSKLTVTDFSKRTGSPFHSKELKEDPNMTHTEVLQNTDFVKQKEKQADLLQKISKKTAEYQTNKPSSGVFTEVVTHGAFTSKISHNTGNSNTPETNLRVSPPKTLANGTNVSKSLLGFPSSANELALAAKSDLESDKNISEEIKDKLIEKLFALASMAQHIYESKVRIMTEFEKYKETHMKNEIRREKEHSEQLYKLNINFQTEVVQEIQRLRSELDISRDVVNAMEKNNRENNADRYSSVDYNVTGEIKSIVECNENNVDLNCVSASECNVSKSNERS